MSRWRVAVVAALFALPVAVLAMVGVVHLWQSGWWFYAWWPLTACFGIAYLLLSYWHRKERLLPRLSPPPMHWTERDKTAWVIVQARAKTLASIPLEKLSDPHAYVDDAKAMVDELAHFYHPNSADPVDRLTIPELLAVIELAAHDLANTVTEFLPGGHILTVGDWKRAGQMADWYKNASNAYWLGAVLLDPLRAGTRFLASQFGLNVPWQQFQQNLSNWFYAAYINRMGHYLIELYSGRLRVGATRYRALKAAFDSAGQPAAPTAAEPDADAELARTVTVTLMGQVNAGKSSLINALLGEARAASDALPATDTITGYKLGVGNSSLVIQDTVGYGHEGPRADQIAATQKAAQKSDLLLLVLHGRTAARQADQLMLDALVTYFTDKPELRLPPILAVLTHIDLLSPAMEWKPPYDWQTPTRPKEKQIADAVLFAREQFPGRLATVVPVCTASGKLFGIDESLMPAMTELLGEARSVALLRALHKGWDRGEVKRVFGQFAAAGRQLFQAARGAR